MQNTNISQEPIFFQNSSFEISQVEVPNKFHEVALQSFYDLQKELSNRVHHYKNKQDGSTLLSGFIVSSVPVSGFFVSLWDTKMILAFLGSIVIATPAVLYSKYYEHYLSETNKLLNESRLVYLFHESYKDFSSEPQEIKIKKIFDHFEAIDQDGKLLGFVEKKDADFLQSTAKLFLMDAIAKILQKKNPDSLVAKQWNETLNAKNDESEAEPWQSMGILNPTKESYLEFKHTQFFGLVEDEIFAIFTNAIKSCLNNNRPNQSTLTLIDLGNGFVIV